MIRALGAMLVAGCGLWLGNHQARQLEQRVQILENLELALEQAGRELELCRTPLPRLFRSLSGSVPWPADGLFAACAEALEREEMAGVPEIWAAAVARVPGLEREEQRLLEGLGLVLGRYPGPEQEKAIFGVCRGLEQCALRAGEDSRRLGRVYRAMGAAGGGFLVIFLL